MGGEAGRIEQGKPVQAKVFGQMESYDPATDTWQHHAPMPTPRHAVGATVIGDWVYVAGGGAVLGGSIQSAVHEAFTLGRRGITPAMHRAPTVPPRPGQPRSLRA
jgi:hypothetical protein